MSSEAHGTTEPARRSSRCSRRRARRLSDDIGAVGGAEVLPLAVLTFVIGSLMTANLWAVVDARFAVDSAAREAARRYVEAPDEATARTEAHEAAAEAIAGQGRDPALMEIAIEHPDGRDWAACVPTVVIVRYPVHARGLPGLGDDRIVTVEARHHQVVDPWRSGLPHEGGCR